MKYTTPALCALMAMGNVFAANLETPPEVQTVPAAKQTVQTPVKVGVVPPARKQEEFRLEPTEADMLAARKARENNKSTQPAPYVSKNGTKIESITDQNKHLTSVRVTPGMTDVPYTMQNKADRPIENGPTANTRQTLGTPEFIKFKW